MSWFDPELCIILNEIEEVYEVPIPSTYVVLDVETTGLNFEEDVIFEISIMKVYDGKPVLSGPEVIYLDWSSVIGYDRFRMKIVECQRRMMELGKVLPVDLKKLFSEGKRPKEGFEELSQKMKDVEWVVAYNGYAFDFPMIVSNLRYWLERSGQESEEIEQLLDYMDNRMGIFDAGLLEKARQIPLYPSQFLSLEIDDLYVPENKGLAQLDRYWRGVSEYRAPVKWNLHEHAAAIYEFERYGILPEHSHKAGYDVYATYLVFETMRSTCAGFNQAESVDFKKSLGESP